jgi:hypothetical protein
MEIIGSILREVFSKALEKWIQSVVGLREKVGLRIIKITSWEDTRLLGEALKYFDISSKTPLFLIAGGIRKNQTEASIFNSVPLEELLEDEGFIIREGGTTEVPDLGVTVETTSVPSRSKSKAQGLGYICTIRKY